MYCRPASVGLIMGIIALTAACNDQSGPTGPTTSAATLSGGSGSGGSSAPATSAGASTDGGGAGALSVSTTSGGSSGTSVLPTISGTGSGPVTGVVHVAGDTLIQPDGAAGGVAPTSPLLQPTDGGANSGASAGVDSSVVTPVIGGVTVDSGTAAGGVLAPVLGSTTSTGGTTSGLLTPVVNGVNGVTAPATGGGTTGTLLNGVLR